MLFDYWNFSSIFIWNIELRQVVDCFIFLSFIFLAVITFTRFDIEEPYFVKNFGSMCIFFKLFFHQFIFFLCFNSSSDLSKGSFPILI